LVQGECLGQCGSMRLHGVCVCSGLKDNGLSKCVSMLRQCVWVQWFKEIRRNAGSRCMRVWFGSRITAQGNAVNCCVRVCNRLEENGSRKGVSMLLQVYVCNGSRKCGPMRLRFMCVRGLAQGERPRKCGSMFFQGVCGQQLKEMRLNAGSLDQG
jgi:hypothetical protein